MKTYYLLKVALPVLVVGSLAIACQKKDYNFQRPNYYEVKSEQSSLKFDAAGAPLVPGNNEIVLKLFPAKTSIDLSATEEWCHPALEMLTDSTVLLKISLDANPGKS